MFTYEQQKQAFSYFYCKRVLLEDGISTEPLDLVLSPGHAQDICTFNRYQPLSPWYISEFCYHKYIFTSVSQCLLHSKVVFHDEPDLIPSVLLSDTKRELEDIDDKFVTKSKWALSWEQVLTDICKAKASQTAEVKQLLIDSADQKLIYADEWDDTLGCGLTEKLAKLRPVISHPGNNIMGSVWEEVREKI